MWQPFKSWNMGPHNEAEQQLTPCICGLGGICYLRMSIIFLSYTSRSRAEHGNIPLLDCNCWSSLDFKVHWWASQEHPSIHCWRASQDQVDLWTPGSACILNDLVSKSSQDFQPVLQNQSKTKGSVTRRSTTQWLSIKAWDTSLRP